MSFRLALDAMGGDFGPSVVIGGLDQALKNAFLPSDSSFLIFGFESEVLPVLAQYPTVQKRASFTHTDVIVTNTSKPSWAVRQGRKSNLGQAIQSVVDDNADAVVSAGNTGAYMALSKILMKTLPGIERPAIPALVPTLKKPSLVLDLGANLECSAENLIQFALMGEALVSHLFDIPSPSVGLLNVGSEELKGHAAVQLAAQNLKNIPQFNFYGFVEGNDIMAGTTDVVVTDGFSGNIALKAIEGTARFIKQIIRDNLSSSWRGKLSYLMSKDIFQKIHNTTDPRLHNGAVFLGLRHIAVKSHGGTDALGISHAVRVAYQMSQKKLIESLEKRLSSLNQVGEIL